MRYDKASCLESPAAALRRQDPVHARFGNYQHALYRRIRQETYHAKTGIGLWHPEHEHKIQ